MNPTVRIFLGSRALAATFHLWKGLRMDWLKIQGGVGANPGRADPEGPIMGGS